MKTGTIASSRGKRKIEVIRGKGGGFWLKATDGYQAVDMPIPDQMLPGLRDFLEPKDSGSGDEENEPEEPVEPELVCETCDGDGETESLLTGLPIPCPHCKD